MFDLWDTPLGMTIDKNDMRMGTLLLESNANPCKLHESAYQHIFDVKSKEIIGVLIQSRKTSWNERDPMQKTFLHKKINESNIALLKIGLDACS